MESKSLFKNSALYIIKTLIGVVIPLISFPLVTRILGVENYGKVAYSNNIANYFIYFAALGMSTYAIREGAKCQNDKDKLSKLAKELLTINIISSLIAYILLLLISNITFFKDYFLLILIHSIVIIFQTFGFEWIYQVKEKYAYISIRHIIFQIIGLIFLVLFMKEKEDYYIYAIYTVFTSCADNIINIIFLPKHIKLNKKYKLELKKHVKPIFYIFSISIISTILQNIDTTLIGIFINDFQVGLYNSALKIFNIVNSVIASISVVFFSRMTTVALEEKNKENKQNSLIIIFSIVLFYLVLPMMIGIICIGDQLILLICGEEYLDSGIVLQVYAIVLILSSINRVFGHQILLVNNEERTYFKSTIICFLLKLILNIILLPIYGIIICAISSIIGELLSDIYLIIKSKKYVNPKELLINLLKPTLFSIPILLITIILRNIISNIFYQVLIIILLSVVSYGTCDYFEYREIIKNKIKKSKLKQMSR